MRQRVRAWYGMIAVALVGGVRVVCAQQTGGSAVPAFDVLCLHSYHQAAWTDAIMEGYRDALGDVPGITWHVEYMDTKRLQTPAYLAQLAALYRTKYADATFDGVLLSDDHALAFALKHRAELFPGAPLVFCGVNDFRPEMLQGAPDVTGVVEQGDFAQTVHFVRQVRPDMRTLHVICDRTRTGRLNLDALQDVVRREHPALGFQVLDDTSVTALRDALTRVPGGDAVFFISYWSDAEGHSVAMYDLSGVIRGSPVPVFGRSEWMMGEGLAGGMCVRGRSQGRSAGRLLRQIRNGTAVRDLPVVTESPNEFMVDLAVFRQYGIPRARVPVGSVILNAPRSVLEIPKPLAWTTLVLMIALVSLVGVLVLDIQMRRRYARRLAASEAKYREVFDGAGEAIFVHDAVTARILDVNRTMLEMFGVTREEALALTPEQFSSGEPPYTAAAVARWMAKAREEGPQTIVWHTRRKDGSTFWVQVMLTHSRIGGQDRILAVVHDISARRAEQARARALRESLVQARRLESLGLLASGVAHDLNNMLGPVLAMPGLITEELDNVLQGDEEASNRVRKDLNGIETAAVRAAETIKDLLMLSRQGGVAKVVLDLSAVIEEALASRDIQAARSAHPQVEVAFCRGGEVLEVMGASTNLIRAVSNVVRNALEAVGERGRITLELTRCALAQGVPGDPTSLPGDYARVRVRDNGCGIAADQIDRVFDPFFSRKARSASSGTGMGLPIVHSILRDHGGGVQLRSTAGEGTAVDLYLPLSQEATTAGESPSEFVEERGDETLWVVDDDPGQRLILQRILRRLGYDVETLASGEAAVAGIRQASGAPPDLILMDVMMGEGLTGLDALAQIRVAAPEVKVVMISGLSDAATVEMAQQLGADWISKPFLAHELAHHIRRVLTHDT